MDRPDVARRRAREWPWFLVAAVFALAPRILFARAFPTIPISDFASLVAFAVFVRDNALAPTGAYQFFGIGLPFGLALVMKVVPGPAPEVARYATAAVTGLAALAPFVIWRGVFRMATRLAATLLLALWPGHVFFSTAVAQDNWIFLPTIALAALAVRTLTVRDEGHPFASAILFAASVAIRQEMIVAAAPLTLAAAGAFGPRPLRKCRLCVWAVAALLGLLTVALPRWAASGHFSLGAQHSGLTVLGAAAPGAGASYWTFPQTYFAAYQPDLVDDWEAMRERSMALAVRELRRRPLYHAIRMISAGVNCLARSDRGSFAWTVGSPEVLPASHRARGEWLTARAGAVLDAGPVLALGLFLGGLLLARGRSAPLLVLGSALTLKVLVHAVTVAQPRYYAVVTALSLLGAAAAVELAGPSFKRLGASLAGGLLLSQAFFRAGAPLERFVVSHEEQLTYRFVLGDDARGPRLECTMARGILAAVNGRGRRQASIRPLRPDPLPGDEAVAECRVARGQDAGEGALQVQDTYALSPLPGRILQSVLVDGREVLRHDIGAEPGTGWATVTLPPHARWVVVRVLALHPDPGALWGLAAVTPIRVVPADAVPRTPP